MNQMIRPENLRDGDVASFDGSRWSVKSVERDGDWFFVHVTGRIDETFSVRRGDLVPVHSRAQSRRGSNGRRA